jgi:hypothetical protein
LFRAAAASVKRPVRHSDKYHKRLTLDSCSPSVAPTKDAFDSNDSIGWLEEKKTNPFESKNQPKPSPFARARPPAARRRE